MTSGEHDGQVDLLIMAAHALELEGLRAALGAHAPTTLHRRTIGLCEVGVGAMLAGAGAMRNLLEARPRAVVLVGSCGVYPGYAVLQPGQLLVPSQVVAVDAAVLAARAAFPAPMPTSVETDQALVQALLASAQSAAGDTGAPAPLHAALATTLAITTDDALAEELGRGANCVAENLEALPIALACHMQGVAFTAVLAVTNEVGSRGRAQWREHHALAARTTADCVLRWLHSGAEGLSPR